MYKVMIVDDSKLARMSIARALGRLQPEWCLVEATNADEAVTLVSRERPNIALLDFNMPGRDGLALAAELRALAPQMPIALVSANLQKSSPGERHLIRCGFPAKTADRASFVPSIDADAEEIGRLR